MSDDLSRPFPADFIAGMSEDDLKKMCREAHRHGPAEPCWIKSVLAERAKESR